MSTPAPPPAGAPAATGQAAAASAPAPAASSAPVPAAEGAGGLTAAEAEQLGELLAKKAAAAVAAGEAIMMRVEKPHESLTHGGVTVTNDPTPVPVSMAAAIMTAAEDAGVKITQEG